jgi:hypothetical protein
VSINVLSDGIAPSRFSSSRQRASNSASLIPHTASPGEHGISAARTKWSAYAFNDGLYLLRSETRPNTISRRGNSRSHEVLDAVRGSGDS